MKAMITNAGLVHEYKIYWGVHTSLIPGKEECKGDANFTA
jgi:hypothetical protein